jgi:hypothetical protein
MRKQLSLEKLTDIDLAISHFAFDTTGLLLYKAKFQPPLTKPTNLNVYFCDQVKSTA